MVIIGAKGFARCVIQVLIDNGESDNNIFLYDDISHDLSDRVFDKYKVIRSTEELRNFFLNHSHEFNLGVGGPKIRSTLYNKISGIGGVLSTITSKFALIGNYNVNLAKGLTIMEYAIIENDTTIGKGSLINKFSIIGHDVNVGEFCEVSVSSKLLGGASVGDYSQISANATVLNNICVGSYCVVGAGAVVTKDVPDHSIVVGVPARELKRE